MPGARTFISSFLLAAVAALGQVPDYFPLEVGNVWIYRAQGAPPRPGDDTVTIEVTRADNFKGATYYLVTETRRRSYWLRNDGTGRIYQFDEVRGEERLWYDFSRQTGDTYATAAPSCCGEVHVANTKASKQVALGDFDKAFYQHTYPGVFQVGITEEDFLPYVGLVFRSENTGGPSFRSLDLTYAKISGVTVLNASGLGFGVARAKDYARIFLNNNTGAPLRIVFRSGQTFELILLDAEGKTLYRWSDGLAFTQALRAVDLPPGETSWPVAIPDIPGASTLTVELVTVGHRFTATLPLQTGSSSRP
ncbi:MAG: BsuPI-related putative proteinase inhibitor [Bryobacteraceae bacterium]